jgi:hypothetical protein
MRTRNLPRLGTAVLLALASVLAGAAPAVAAPPRTAACEGAVVHTVDAARPGTLPRLCVAVGGVVRVVHLGPGSLRPRPARLVDCFYAGGTYQCRLTRTGTVRLSLGERTLTVRVPARVPGRPSTACTPAGRVVNLDTLEELPWWSPCLRTGATLRVIHLGPGRLSVTPAGVLACRYEAGIHACRVRRPGTVVVTATPGTSRRSVAVVAVR